MNSNIDSMPFPSLLRTTLWAALLGASAAAQDIPVRSPGAPIERPASHVSSTPFDIAQVAGQPLDELLFDEPGDGAVWARGTGYKARFDSRGATLIPFLGSDAPRNYPVQFRLVGARLGDQTLELSATPTVRRDGNVVRIDHGALVEEYELTLESLEQRYVLASLPTRGELVLSLEVDTELERSDLGARLRFENELGRVDYGEAFAIDGAGRGAQLDSRLIDGTLELRVPATFVQGAALPLLVDPFITFYTAAGGSGAQCSPDVAYDVSTDRWCISYVNVFSATDYDVYCRFATGNYQLLNVVSVDVTSESWSRPAIANNNAADAFLTVAMVAVGGGFYDIRGRMVYPTNSTTGTPFQISGFSAVRANPDVGGDPWPSGVSYFCVVWERVVNSSNSDIECQMVAPSGAIAGGAFNLENSSDQAEQPAISNSFGLDVGDGTARWTVAWQHRISTSNRDIYGTQLAFNGTVLYAPFPMVASTWDETAPAVSTMLDPGALGVQRPYLVVCERDYGDHDLIAAVGRGSVVSAAHNLVGDFDPSYWYRDQRTPSVDSDGEQFLVGFDERDVPGGPNPDVLMCSYYVDGGSLIPCEVHKYFAGSGQVEGEIAVHSMASSAGPRKHYCGAWVYLHSTNSYDVQAGLWDGCSGGLVDAFCFGTGAGCPCGNGGASGHGCANSAGSAGGRLSATGNASLGADTLTMYASDLPTTAPCLFFQSVGSGGPFALGDGLRCTTGAVKRFPIRISSGGTASYPGPANPPIHVVGGISLMGTTRYYQAYYRDNGSYCTPATFSVTNGLRVIWGP